MNIAAALLSLTPYPVPQSTVSRILLDRDLIEAADYTKNIGISPEFELAQADLFIWVATAHNFSEQDVSFSLGAGIKEELVAKGNAIYAKYGDSKLVGRTFGYIGENYG